MKSRYCLFIFTACLFGQQLFAQTLKDSLLNDIGKKDFHLIPELRKKIAKDEKKNLTIKEEEETLDSARVARNTFLSSIFVENTQFTHITPSMMVVGGDWESVLDADINFNLFPMPKHFRVGAIINPHFNMRMFLDKESAPIRTPSNMIGATVFTHLSNGYDSVYQFISGSFFHHSNGQDRGSYNEDGTINLHHGNFAVNYIDLNYMYGWIDHFKDRSFNNYIKFGLQKDFVIGDEKDINPTNGEKALVQEYGQFRANFELSFSRYKFKDWGDIKNISDTDKRHRKFNSYQESPFYFFRYLIDGSVIRADGKWRLNAELKGYIKIAYSPNFLITAQAGWLGHDYYNIYFNEQTWVFRIGVAAAFLAGPGSKPGDIEGKYKNAQRPNIKSKIF